MDNNSPGPVVQPQQQPQQQPLAPQQPLQPQQSPVGPQPMGMQPEPSKKKSKAWVAGLLLAVLFIGGGGAVLAQNFINSPSKIWERALSTTSKGYDKFTELLTEDAVATGTEGFTVDGSFKVSSPLAADGSVDGHFNADGSALMTMDVGAAGFRMDGEIRSISIDDTTSPDVYFKLDGLETIGSLLSLLGESEEDLNIGQAISDANDQWYVIDHTLTDQLMSSLATDEGVATVTPEDIVELYAAVGDVMDEYVFTVDEEKAVFTVVEEIGKEDFEGTDTYKFKAGVEKDNFKQFITSLNNAIKDTEYADFFVQSLGAGSDVTYDEIIDIDELLDDIDESDFTDAYADVWVESNGMYFRNIRFYDVYGDTDAMHFDVGIPYEGGDVIPFAMKLSGDDGATDGTLSFGMDINIDNGNGRFWFDLDVADNGTSIVASGEMNLVNTNDVVDVSKPEDARNVYDLLAIFDTDFAIDGTDPTSLEEFYELPTIDDIEI